MCLRSNLLLPTRSANRELRPQAAWAAWLSRAPRKLVLRAMLLFLAVVIPATAQTVRIGVFGLFKPHQFTVTAVEGSALAVTAGPQSFVLDPSGGLAALKISASGSQLQVSSLANNAYTGSVRASARDGRAGEFILAVPGKLRRKFSGVLQVTADAGVLTAVVEMDLEVAVASAVQAESPPGALLEALKAQAVATRSYLVAGTGGHKTFDFCDTTHCQFLREPPPVNAPTSIAARATRGLVLAYAGHPFPALYSASCGGYTHTLADAGLPVRDYPYYAVSCEYCRTHPTRWATRLASTDAAALSGGTEAERLKLARRLGWSSVRSNDYVISLHQNQFVVSGVGSGHGIGLCQRGAAAMARAGAGYRAILAHYYPNTSIATIETAPPRGR
jgi:stage II sporulation protein D